MANGDTGQSNRAHSEAGTRVKDFPGLTRRLLLFANVGVPRTLYLRVLSNHLLEGAGADAVEIRATDGDVNYAWVATLAVGGGIEYSMKYYAADGSEGDFLADWPGDPLAEARRTVFERRGRGAGPNFTPNGSFLTGDARAGFVICDNDKRTELQYPGPYRTIVITRFEIDRYNAGLVALKSTEPEFFNADDVETLELIAQAIGITIATRRAQRALRERVKELSCLLSICQMSQKTDTTVADVIAHVLTVLARAFQFPERARGRAVIDGAFYGHSFQDVGPRLSAPITIENKKRGVLEVGYAEPLPEGEGVTFSIEEKQLLDAVARQVGSIVQRREAAAERELMEEQLRHADRLATIGQLAAGIAHELNEPLLSIIGFTQLLLGRQDLPEDIKADLEKVSGAALHAREVVKKVLIFARQAPTRKGMVDLNDIVEDVMNWLDARFAEENVKKELNLNHAIPDIWADASQLQQMVVNLVVNALQATPPGGKVTVSTDADDEHVYLTVEDTGCGMTEEVQQKMFLPFFTTKEVGRGTGLGLAVVHGVVMDHGGSIGVKSEVGKGSKFLIILPIRPPAKEEGYELH